MEWSGKEAFVNSSEKPFTVDGKEAGVLKSHGPLSFLKVRSVLFRVFNSKIRIFSQIFSL